MHIGKTERADVHIHSCPQTADMAFETDGKGRAYWCNLPPAAARTRSREGDLLGEIVLQAGAELLRFVGMEVFAVSVEHGPQDFVSVAKSFNARQSVCVICNAQGAPADGLEDLPKFISHCHCPAVVAPTHGEVLEALFVGHIAHCARRGTPLARKPQARV